MQYHLVKSEPGSYSFDDLVRDERTVWDGVRNPEAKKHLRSMKQGDRVLYYHTGDQKAVVGVAKVVREAYPDPSAGSGDWSAVDLVPLAPLSRAVTLAEIKRVPSLAELLLVRRGRLSVMPIGKREFETILKLGKTRLR
jgi:predicted RNA-binding protein with PUA-like domain